MEADGCVVWNSKHTAPQPNRLIFIKSKGDRLVVKINEAREAEMAC